MSMDQFLKDAKKNIHTDYNEFRKHTFNDKAAMITGNDEIPEYVNFLFGKTGETFYLPCMIARFALKQIVTLSNLAMLFLFLRYLEELPLSIEQTMDSFHSSENGQFHSFL